MEMLAAVIISTRMLELLHFGSALKGPEVTVLAITMPPVKPLAESRLDLSPICATLWDDV
jgi:hypothetical protein|tara:strand:+ start:76 stop:255 length:180 start_codon:yes stop_codon:yes gene_type:complete